MKAVRFHDVGDLRVEDLPDPEPALGEVLVAPEYVGICATDTHILDGHFPSRPPVVLGHEIAGRIVELGESVDHPVVGQRITVEPHLYCGICLYCQIGQEHMCVDKQAYGVHLNGGMADLIAVPARLAYPLPEEIPSTWGAMTEPIACSVHAMDRLDPVSGLPLAIFGCGPAGAVLISLARHAGLYPIVAIDPRQDRRDLAKRVGADVVLDPSSENFRDDALDLTHGYGFSYLIDAVGSAGIIETAIEMAARRATILFFGVADPESVSNIHPNDVYAKELSLLGTAINPFTHRRAVGMLSRLPLQHLKFAEYPLEHAQEAIQAQRDGVFDKVLLKSEANGPSEDLARAGAGAYGE